MKYKSFSKFITEKSAQTDAREFQVAGYRFSKQGGERLKQKCAQFKLSSEEHTSCMYGQTDDKQGDK